jgi:UrcA family protein
MKIAMGCLLLAASLNSLNTVAATAIGEGPAQRVVDFADLDLSGVTGAAELYTRIGIAAQAVCEPLNARELASLNWARHCVRKAIDRAIADVNVPTLTTYHLAQTTRSTVSPQQ